MSVNFDKKKYLKSLRISEGERGYFDIKSLTKDSNIDINKIPFSIRVLIENVLRSYHNDVSNLEHINNLVQWNKDTVPDKEFPYMPGRVVLQDFTGVPVVVDLAAMRDAVTTLGVDPSIINPIVRSDLVIDHSVQVDSFAQNSSLSQNISREFERNQERYKLLKWAQNAFSNFLVVPPGTGIVHQVNLENLAEVILSSEENNLIFPDTCVGTDSHTTMINGVGVLGWGVGGIEAEAVMLGQPYYMQVPEVIGVNLYGNIREGTTATDVVLGIVEKLREVGVVEKFVEFFGSGLKNLSLTDRATISNMAPEYGATCGFFPVDERTMDYLTLTGRDNKVVDRVENYTQNNSLFYEGIDPEFTKILDFDLSSVQPSLAGPKRPQDRLALSDVKSNFHSSFDINESDINNDELDDGSVVIAAITSCTNTSNPNVMMGAGIIAKNASEKGIKPKSWVKTSLAPGSKVVSKYLESAGLDKYLDDIGFGNPVFLKDLWPSANDIEGMIDSSLKSKMFIDEYKSVFEGPKEWKELSSTKSNQFRWDDNSTYIQKPPYFENFDLNLPKKQKINDARCLVVLGNSVTTDHISPAGSIPQSAPSGQLLISSDVPRFEFNSYGSRRGNHNIMVRGTFGNIRLRNQILDDEGDWTIHFPSGEKMRIFEASELYQKEETPLIVIAGKEYGTGSSRDWAAKGPALLGVKVGIAESFERIHRSNLVCMGIVPLQFQDGDNFENLRLDGSEHYDFFALEDKISPNSEIEVLAKKEDGSEVRFKTLLRIDTQIEAEYYYNGGLLPFVLRKMVRESK